MYSTNNKSVFLKIKFQNIQYSGDKVEFLSGGTVGIQNRHLKREVSMINLYQFTLKCINNQILDRFSHFISIIPGDKFGDKIKITKSHKISGQ